jgi:hypothetical protein
MKRRRAHHAACAGRALHGDRALDALWPRTDVMGHPKVATLGQLAGLQPSRPLWSWAVVKPEVIVDFSIFLKLFK